MRFLSSRPVRTLALWLTSGWDWERNRRQTLGDRQGGSGLDGCWDGPRTRGSHSRQAERVARHQREGSSTGRLVRLSHTSSDLLACVLTCSALSATSSLPQQATSSSSSSRVQEQTSSLPSTLIATGPPSSARFRPTRTRTASRRAETASDTLHPGSGVRRLSGSGHWMGDWEGLGRRRRSLAVRCSKVDRRN